MFESALGRVPTDDQVARLTEFVESQAALKNVPVDNPAVWEDVAHALINTKDFIYLR